MMSLYPLSIYNYVMTVVVSIATRDRVVVLADSRVQDTEKGIIDNQIKVFELSSNCTLMIAGTMLHGLDEYVKTLIFNVKDRKIIGAKAIAKHIQEFSELRTWATTPKSHIITVISGYEGDEPFVLVKLSTGVLEEILVKCYVSTNWEGATGFLMDRRGYKTYDKLGYKSAERIAIELLDQAKKEIPDEVGGEGNLWHVTKHKIQKKSPNYLKALRKKYAKDAE